MLEHKAQRRAPIRHLLYFINEYEEINTLAPLMESARQQVKYDRPAIAIMGPIGAYKRKDEKAINAITLIEP